MLRQNAVLLACLLALAFSGGCSSKDQPDVPLSTATDVRHTPRAATATATASAPHAGSDATFIYYGSCFDLDEGVRLGSTSPECEFVLQPKASQALIDFIPGNTALFSQLDEFPRQPAEADCRSSATLAGSAQTIDLHSGGYLCYRTGEGRYGYLRFLDSATNGLNIAWLTFEEEGVVSIYPTETPVQVQSAGRDRSFRFGWYFDADLGEASKARIDSSDFALRPISGGDELLFNLQPVSPARFSAQEDVASSPGSLTCQQAAYAAAKDSLEALVLKTPAYVCFQSGDGRYGYLYIHTRQDEGVIFDWRTFSPVFESEPAETATPSPLHAEGLEQQIYFRSYFDLDDGSQAGEQFDGSDMLLYPAPGGASQVELVPQAPASFTFDEMLYEAPDAFQCSLSPSFNSQAHVIDAFGEDGAYLCFQSSQGRYGYLRWIRRDGNSVTLDWHTFDPPAEIIAPPSQQKPDEPAAAYNVPPPGDPMWRDTFDSATGWQLAQNTSHSFEVRDGSLHISALNPDNTDGMAFSGQNISEYYLEAVFKSASVCSSLDHYGLVFGGSEQGDSGYLFGISCDGRYVLRYVKSGSYTTLITWTEHELIRRGGEQRNRLGVLAQNGRLLLYANGVLLAQKEQPEDAAAGGRFGVHIGSARSDFFQVDVEDIAYWSVR